MKEAFKNANINKSDLKNLNLIYEIRKSIRLKLIIIKFIIN